MTLAKADFSFIFIQLPHHLYDEHEVRLQVQWSASFLKEFKANLSVIFIIENIVRIITYISLGVISFATLKQVVILLPFMLGGLFAGIFSAKVLNEAIAKKLVIVLLIISGLALVLMNI